MFLTPLAFSQDTAFVRDTPLVKTVRDTQSAVAAIYVRKEDGQSSGSGSVIDPRGYLLTAQHVVGDDHVVLLRGRPPMRATMWKPRQDCFAMRLPTIRKSANRLMMTTYHRGNQ